MARHKPEPAPDVLPPIRAAADDPMAAGAATWSGRRGLEVQGRCLARPSQAPTNPSSKIATAARINLRSTHLAVQARIELIRGHLALADNTGARTLMREIEEILGHRPDLGTLVGQVKQLQARLGKQHGADVPGASALTAAELHLLPLQCTHMTVPEIAAELFLSPHTIRSQMKSIYRKLEATNRHQAITRARELELIDR